MDSGQYLHGTYLAERASEVDPEAEEIQLALVQLYRMAGAHAAAAEKYGQYATDRPSVWSVFAFRRNREDREEDERVG
jgi:hypothetical protein